MRIRKFRGARAPRIRLRSSAKPTSFGLDGQIAQLLPQHDLQKPTTKSAAHPNSQRFELDLYKYSTGIMSLEESLKKRSLLSDISLKVYASRPFSRKEMLYALSSSLESTNPAESLRSALTQAFGVARIILSLSKTIHNVFFQVFERSRYERNQSKTSTPTNTNAWSLSCQLYRNDDLDHLPSRPWFEVDVSEVYITEYCRIKENPAEVFRVQHRLGFHLKPHIFDDSKSHGVVDWTNNSTGIESPNQSFQVWVDGIIKQTFRSIRGQIFADVDEMVGSVRNSVLAYLRSSPLAAMVELHFLSTIALGWKSERFVYNTLLNADGSPKPATTSLEASLSPDTGKHQFGTLVERPSADVLDSSNVQNEQQLLDSAERGEARGRPGMSTQTYHTLSEALREKIGTCEFTCIVFPKSKTSQPTQQRRPEELLEQFDRMCQMIDGNGLACVASVAASLAAEYPDICVHFMSKQLKFNVNPALDHVELPADVVLSLRTDRSEARIRLPNFIDLNYSLLGSSTRANRLNSCRVSLYGTHAREVSESAPQIFPEEEFNLLTQMASTVIQGICKEVEFESHEAIPHLLAEGLLRTLRFPSTGSSIQKVKVSVRLSKDLNSGISVLSAEKERSHDTSMAFDEIDSKSGLATDTPKVTLTTGTRASQAPEKKATLEREKAGLRAQPEVSTAGTDSIAVVEEAYEPTESETADDSTFIEDEVPSQSSSDARTARVFIALGSNLGDRLQNIENACREIDAEPDMRILRTSALYETAPMYVEDQNHFLNGACEIETTLGPTELLDKLQAIEQRLGRVKTVDKGPRNIDLDILLFRNERIQTDRLTIPHPLMFEREFVLRPLCDIPSARWRTPPGKTLTFGMFLKNLPQSTEPMYPLNHLAPSSRDIRLGDPQSKTRIMSILNVTPDSFSDGGLHQSRKPEELASFAKFQIATGATIIDIGGQSSRPNAPDISAEEEISRILPAIEAIKSLPEAADVAISVDTYRAVVAEAAVEAGAHVINDISAGLLDSNMLPTIARLGCTYIMMHMRGTPATMMSKENCTYANGLITGIAEELGRRIEAAQAAGIRRWRIILDPGIGFSKSADQNILILRKFSTLKDNSALRNFPWLVGSSRKSFIGKITGVQEPNKRGWGTAATVTAAIQGGADIVRVHNAEETNAVVKMADAMYRV